MHAIAIKLQISYRKMLQGGIVSATWSLHDNFACPPAFHQPIFAGLPSHRPPLTSLQSLGDGWSCNLLLSNMMYRQEATFHARLQRPPYILHCSLFDLLSFRLWAQSLKYYFFFIHLLALISGLNNMKRGFLKDNNGWKQSKNLRNVMCNAAWWINNKEK